MSLQLSGTVESFDADAFRRALARRLDVPTSDIVLDIAPASVHVVARIIAPDTAAAQDQTVNIMNALTPIELASELGVTVESLGTAAIATVSVPLPSPPPLAPPLQPPIAPSPVPSMPPSPAAPPPLTPQLSAGMGILLSTLLGVTVITVAFISGAVYWWQAKRTAAASKVKRNEATIVLQAAMRRRLAIRVQRKRRLQRLGVQMRVRQFVARLRSRNTARKRLQARTRGFLVRTRLRLVVKHKAAEYIQSYARGMMIRVRIRLKVRLPKYRMRLKVRSFATRLKRRWRAAEKWRALVEARLFLLDQRAKADSSALASALGSVADWLWSDKGLLMRRHLAVCRIRFHSLMPPAAYDPVVLTPTLLDSDIRGILSGSISGLGSNMRSPSVDLSEPRSKSSPARSLSSSRSFADLPFAWRHSPSRAASVSGQSTSPTVEIARAERSATSGGELTRSRSFASPSVARRPANDLKQTGASPVTRSISFSPQRSTPSGYQAMHGVLLSRSPQPLAAPSVRREAQLVAWDADDEEQHDITA